MLSHAGRPVAVKSVEVPLSNDFTFGLGTSGLDWQQTARPDGRTTTDRREPLPDAGDGPETLMGSFGWDILSGRGGDDVIFGLPGNDSISGGNGDNFLVGGLGQDVIVAAGGNDLIRGGGGNDNLNGGSGDDSLFGGTGGNYFFYNAEDNIGDSDVYVGLLGSSDVLELSVTEDIWFDATFQEELGDWVFLQSLRRPDLEPFEFTSLGLTVRGIEAMRLFVDDLELDPTDQRVVLLDDAYSLNAEIGVLAGYLLENDNFPDLLASIAIESLPSYGSVTVSKDGSFVYTLDLTNPAVAALEAGETIEDWFTYKVTDADGDTGTATASVTIFDPLDVETAFGFVIYGALLRKSREGFIS